MGLEQLKVEEFDAFAGQHAGSFLQTRAMRQELLARGNKILLLGQRLSNGQLKNAALLTVVQARGGQILNLNFGPLGEWKTDFAKDLRDYAKKQQVFEVVWQPDLTAETFNAKGESLIKFDSSWSKDLIELGFKTSGVHKGYSDQSSVAEWQYIKSLEGISDETGLLASYNTNAKRNIKKAIKNGLKVERAEFSQLREVAKLIGQTGTRRHFETKDTDYYEKMSQAFGQDLEALLVKDENGKVHAAGLFIQTAQEFLYLLGGSDPVYGKFGGPFLVQYVAMQHALERGCLKYNFYGISGLFDGSDGVLRFKQNFGGFIEQKLGEFRYSPSPIKYWAIQTLKKLMRRN